MSRRAPRPLRLAVDGLAQTLQPSGMLSRVQSVWEQVAGPAIAAAAAPVAETDGTVTVSCEASVWAQELDLMAPRLVCAINEALGTTAVKSLRCRTAQVPRR